MKLKSLENDDSMIFISQRRKEPSTRTTNIGSITKPQPTTRPDTSTYRGRPKRKKQYKKRWSCRRKRSLKFSASKKGAKTGGDNVKYGMAKPQTLENFSTEDGRIGSYLQFQDYEMLALNTYHWQSVSYRVPEIVQTTRTSRTRYNTQYFLESLLSQTSDRGDSGNSSMRNHTRVNMERQKEKQKVRKSKEQGGSGSLVPSLKTLAIDQIVRYCNFITISHISAVPKWSGFWEETWHKMLKARADTFEKFEIFSNFFAREQRDFPCHWIQNSENVKNSREEGQPRLVRDIVVAEQVIRGIKHRIETIGANILISNFITAEILRKTNDNEIFYVDNSEEKQYLETVNKYVMLSFAGLQNDSNLNMTSASLMQLFNARNSVSLNLSYLGDGLINDSLLMNMILSIKSGKLSNLVMLSLRGAQVRRKKYLIELIETSNIMYIETDEDLQQIYDNESNLGAHNGETGRKVNLKFLKVGRKFLSLRYLEKFHSLLTKFFKFNKQMQEIYEKLYVSKTAMLLDFQFVDKNVQIKGTDADEMNNEGDIERLNEVDELWSLRRRGDIELGHNYHGYIIKRLEKVNIAAVIKETKKPTKPVQTNQRVSLIRSFFKK